MRVVLSGPNGNLGKHIAKNADFTIIPISRGDWDKDDHNLKDADVFVHCAYDLKKSLTEVPDEVMDSNIISLMKALRECKENKIKKFIFISSCSVYGDSSRTSEETQCSPITINGLIKYLCEKVIIDFCEKNQMNYLILRAFNAFGGDDQFSVITKLFNAKKHETKFNLCNDGLAERDFIHVDDAAKVVCHYCKNHSQHKVINIGTGRSTRIIDVYQAFVKKFGPVEVSHKVNKAEIEYSRADIKRLESEVTIDFINVIDYINDLEF